MISVLHLYPLLSIFLAGILFGSSILSGCAINPATQRRELMIVSENEEFKIGQDVDKQVREDMGVYLELPELRAMVKEMGESIGRNSDRPNVIYRIEIIDSPDFNAFAVPGGFVYVHRGLLERLNSSDELASVLGHEIGHVAARHSAAQISKSRLMNIGLMAASVATKGAVQDFGQLINIGAALTFNKFSRDDEREADHLGVIYMSRAGYNPKGSIDAMKIIQDLQSKEPSALETWFMTHPPTSERLLNLNHETQELRLTNPDVLNRPIKRNQYIQLLDGLAVGEWNGNELISKDRYYNKEYLLSLRIPEGWQSRINSSQFTAIFAHPKKEYFACFDIEPLQTRKTTTEYFKDFENKIEKTGLRKVKYITANRPLRHGAIIGVYTDHEKSGVGIAFVKGTNGFSVIGFCKKADIEEFQPLVVSMIEDLQFITEKEAAQLKPPRLKIHKVERNDTWDSITKKYFKTAAGKEKLAEYNGLEVSQGPLPGILLKIPPSLRF